jgi:hypothetical protein
MTDFNMGTYYFRMLAINEIGSHWSNEVDIIVAFPPGDFSLETNSTVPNTDGLFWLNWSQSAEAENYSLYWSTSPNVDESDTLYADGITNDTLRVTDFDTGIYYFRMLAINEIGSHWSNEVEITVEIPIEKSEKDQGDKTFDESEPTIPFGNFYYIILILGMFSLITYEKRKL